MNALTLAYQAIRALDDLLSHTTSGQILDVDAVRRAHLEQEQLRKDYLVLAQEKRGA